MTDKKYYDYCAGQNDMVDTEAIKLAIMSNGYEQKPFADALGISFHTLMNRFKYGNWTVLEAWKLCGLLGLDFTTVFFAHPERLA